MPEPTWSGRVDLRSDTLTKPTDAMLAAIVAAELGDEQKGEDPTVRALEARAAETLGKEAALFVPSATMANQIALHLLGRRGDELLADARSHVFIYELGAPAAINGLVMKPIPGSEGTFTARQLQACVSQPAWYHSGTAVLSVENTHADSGGVVWDPTALAEVVESARAQGVGVHLDGARLMNAAIATASRPDEIAGQFDTVTLCLSKGLGCPVGAVLAMDTEALPPARRFKQMLGGAMRQAGLLAAAGIHALDHHVDRLVEDHDHAKLLARLLLDHGIELMHSEPDTNIVLLDLRHLHPDERARCTSAIAARNVALSSVTEPGVLRAVMHLDITTAQVEAAALRIASVLAPDQRRSPHPHEETS